MPPKKRRAPGSERVVFTNSAHPSLWLPAMGVRFRGGRVTVDAATAVKLRGLPASLRIQEEASDEPVQPGRAADTDGELESDAE